MLIATLALVFGVPALWLAVEIETAPFGYQDEAGFHTGTPVSRNLRDIHGGSDTVPGVQHHGA